MAAPADLQAQAQALQQAANALPILTELKVQHLVDTQVFLNVDGQLLAMVTGVRYDGQAYDEEKVKRGQEAVAKWLVEQGLPADRVAQNIAWERLEGGGGGDSDDEDEDASL